jgi:hypothetical protein
MGVPPLPVFVLLFAVLFREFTILSAPFRQVPPVGAVFAFVPFMPIAMFPVVIPLVVLFVVSASLVFASFFLTLGVGLNCHRRSQDAAQDKWTETTVYAVHPAVLLGSRLPS